MHPTPFSRSSRVAARSDHLRHGKRCPPLRLALLPTVAALLVWASNVQADDAPPSTPTGVSATLYANAGGELFWQRSSDDRGVRGYEVTRNGASLGIFDALSLYDPSLRPGTPYAFTVTAIDSIGQRSDAARVSVGDATGGTATEGPAAPAGLSGRAYSNASGELFWTRTSTPGLRYEVARDGDVVATTDGVSYYTDALRAGTEYAWTVVAIDASGRRSGPAATSFRTPGGAAPTSGAIPAGPAGLTATAYSGTAGELSWTRASTPGFRYEVSRDGTVVATTDGTSYFTDALSAGSAYAWSVVAIAADGSRSAPSTVALTTPGDGPAGPGTTPGTDPTPVTPPSSTDTTPLFPETGSPPAPRNITLAVYSDTTAELNWTRPFFSDGIQLNEIYRDGELYETIPGGGNSYVDDDREAGRGYRYEIVAVKDGRRASTVFIDTGGVQGGPVGTGDPVDASGLPSSVAAALDRTFDLLSLRPFEQVLATVARLDDPTAVGLTFAGERPDRLATSLVFDGYDCPGGGTFSLIDRDEDAPSLDRIIDAQDCTIGPITLSLRASAFSFELDEGSTNRNLNASFVSLADARDDSLVEVLSLRTAFNDATPLGNVFAEGVSIVRDGRAYGAEAFSVRQGPDRSATTIDVGGESVSGALAGNARLRSREALVIGPDNLPTSGAVAIVQLGTNAEAYDINADSGNPDTFLFTATIDGVTTTYDLPWTDVRSIGRPELDGVDVGF